MRLQNKVAIITGSATGIGQGIAARFASEGAMVVVDYVGKPGTADQTLNLIKQAGGKAIAIESDVSNPVQVQQMIDGTIKAFGKLDIFVNNAGIEYKHPFTEFPLEQVQKIIAVNLIGPFLCCQAAARQMIKQGNGGRLINISSVHEDLPMPTNAPYCATKGALRMLTRTIAVELAAHQITVNNIGPGAIFTPIDADVEANPDLEKALMAEIPLGRWGKPQDIAGMATFLASEDGAYCTGATFFVDGGMMRQAGSL